MSEPTNKDRARWAQAALDAFLKSQCNSPPDPDPGEDDIVNLMTDILHLARSKGLEGIEDLQTRALSHFREEDDWSESNLEGDFEEEQAQRHRH